MRDRIHTWPATSSFTNIINASIQNTHQPSPSQKRPNTYMAIISQTTNNDRCIYSEHTTTKPKSEKIEYMHDQHLTNHQQWSMHLFRTHNYQAQVRRDWIHTWPTTHNPPTMIDASIQNTQQPSLSQKKSNTYITSISQTTNNHQCIYS
jgi:hypothetical protein